MTGNQAMQMARAGLEAIYLSGWQVAADANTAGAMYPDQSLYPANAAPELCRRINRTLRRADEIETAEDAVRTAAAAATPVRRIAWPRIRHGEPGPRPPRTRKAALGGLSLAVDRLGDYSAWISASANSEHLISFAPSIRRAKS